MQISELDILVCIRMKIKAKDCSMPEILVCTLQLLNSIARFLLRFVRGAIALQCIAHGVTAGDSLNPSSILGCYIDNASCRDLSQYQTPYSGISNLTRVMCACICYNKGLRYAGANSGFYCFCDNTYGRYGTSPNSCAANCRGDSSVFCGGYTTMNTYPISYSTIIDTSIMGISCNTGYTPPASINAGTCPDATSTHPKKTTIVTTVDPTTKNTKSPTTTGRDTASISVSSSSTEDTYQPSSTTVRITAIDTTENAESSIATVYEESSNLDIRETTSGKGEVTGGVTDISRKNNESQTSKELPTVVSQFLRTVELTQTDEEQYDLADTLSSTDNDIMTTVTELTAGSEKNDSTFTAGILETRSVQSLGTSYIRTSTTVTDAKSTDEVSTKSVDTLSEFAVTSGFVSTDTKRKLSTSVIASTAKSHKLTTILKSVRKSITDVESCVEALPRIQNAYFVGVAKRKIVAVAMYTCKPTYSFYDNTAVKSVSIVCVKGKWPASLPRCSKGLKSAVSNCSGSWKNVLPFETNCTAGGGGCQPFPWLPNTGVTFGPDVRTVNLNCATGYRFPDGQTTSHSVCNDTGAWNVTVACKAIYCPQLHATNAMLSSNDVISGCQVTVTCKAGFMFSDGALTKTVECLDSTDWNETIGPCRETFCPRPPSVIGGIQSGLELSAPNGLYPYGSTIRTSCSGNGALRLEDGKTSGSSTCLGNGYWNPKFHSCEVNRCDPVPVMPNATVNSTLAVPGSVAGYSCDQGFRFSDPGRDHVTCSVLLWLGRVSPCEAILCPVLDVQQGTIDPYNRTPGSEVNVRCDLGHYIAVEQQPIYDIIEEAPEMTETKQNDVNLTCSATGHWSNENVSCKPVECPPPLPLPNSMVTVTSFVYNASAIFSCNSGLWWARGTTARSALCTEDAIWRFDDDDTSVEGQSCRAITCLPLPLHVLQPSLEEMLPGSVVNISCPLGQRLSTGSSSVLARCLDNGQWNPLPSDCVDDGNSSGVVDYRPQLVESPSGNYLAVVAISFNALCVVALLAFDFPVLLKPFRAIWAKSQR